MPDGWYDDYPKINTNMTGAVYYAADGGEIRNLGQRTLGLDLVDGDCCGFNFQVADAVNKPLGADSRIVSRGNRVVFDDEWNGSYIENKINGKRVLLRQENGVYVLDAIVRGYNQPFQRPGL